MEDKQGYAEKVRAVKSFLLTHGWTQGKYFRVKGEKVCACAHGAAQTVSNPRVNAIVRDSKRAKDASFVAAFTRISSADAADAAVAARGALLSCWASREEWIRKDHAGCGNFNLHYLLGLFGITADYNDDKETALEDLIVKLDECSAWAAQHEDELAAT